MAQVRCRGMAQVYLPGAMPLTSSVAWHGSSGEERHGRTLYYSLRCGDTKNPERVKSSGDLLVPSSDPE